MESFIEGCNDTRGHARTDNYNAGRCRRSCLDQQPAENDASNSARLPVGPFTLTIAGEMGLPI